MRGGGEHTDELRQMKYKEAINGPDGEAWKKEIKNEHDRMIKNKVFEELKFSDLPKGLKLLTALGHARKRAMII